MSQGLDLLELAQRATTPTLFLWAMQGIIPRFRVEQLVKAMADARIVDLDAGHLVPMEKPVCVVDEILRAPASE